MLFSNSNNFGIRNKSHKDSTIGFYFNGKIVSEKNGNSKFMPITILPEFMHASAEELRLADHEKKDTGKINKYKINDTTSRVIKNIDNYKTGGLIQSPKNNNNSIFGTLNTRNKNSLFGETNAGNNSIFQSKKINDLFGSIGETNTNPLFGNNNKKNTSLFENNNNAINIFNNSQSLFGNNLQLDNNNSKETAGLFEENKINTSKSIFGTPPSTPSKKSLFGGNNEPPPNQPFKLNLPKTLFNFNSNNDFNDENKPILDAQNKKLRNNINIPSEAIKKCEHEKDFVCYCLVNSKNEGGLLCYECLYKYHKEHIDKCFLIKKNNFEDYKKYYKQYINSQKMNLKEKFDEIISELDDYENEEIEDISKLFEEKVDLDFDLPVNIAFNKRFEIAINRKISSLFEEISFSKLVNPNCINLFKNNINDLKFSENNPNYLETIKFKSSIDFNLKGIGLPKISDIENNLVEAKIYKGDELLGEITSFGNYDNLSIGYLYSTDSELIKIEKDVEYSLDIKGINNLDYVSDEEEYNGESKIQIFSSNAETSLVCFVIE